MTTLQQIYNKNSNGFTITTNLNKIKKKKGFCVSITNNYLKIEDYNKGLKQLHNTLKRGWKDNKLFYLDYTIIENDLNKAVQIAKSYNQKAIFDLNKGEVITIKQQ